jgi:hypothetical protein
MLNNHVIALFFYERAQYLQNYIPILWRLRLIFDESNRSAEFFPIFSIYVSDT